MEGSGKGFAIMGKRFLVLFAVQKGEKMRYRVLLIVAFTALSLPQAFAQGGQRGGGPPQTPRAAAPIDLTGYWVAIVTEDWRWRMVTPEKGDFASIPTTPEGVRIGQQ